jgi:hypothetical protein
MAFLAAACTTTPTLPGRVEIGGGNVGPLPADRHLLVQTTDVAATQTVVAHERATGWPDENIDWEDRGCVLVAWYEKYPMSRTPNPPPPYPVYLVGLKSGANHGWVMVDARTGEIGAYIGDHPEFPCPRS